ncbi:MAG: nucleotidyltransferase domain-containing protein [Desulfocapsaceae bacterium]|nr:nucleotidyltransferase domain-containing protein [Desulfocapsaceae bacterium]
MNDIGITQQELTKIISIFRRHSEIKKVILFGSRAKGTSKPNSDIDIAVDGVISDLQIEALAMELDELSLPYKFDVKSVAGICNPALADHIARVGVDIYP